MSDTDAASIGDVKKGFEAVASSVDGLMKRDGTNAAMTEAQKASFRANLGLSSGGAPGANGWTPVLATVADGERMVQLVQDWVGGSGVKPQAGLYVGATGLVAVAANAVDVRGGEGKAGAPGSPGVGTPGTPGSDGDDGVDGANGWTPIEANVVDGERRVKRIVDWVGGTGPKPATGKYVGPAGLVDTAAEATDMRGAGGAGSGDVTGPATSTNNAVALWDGETGKLLSNGPSIGVANAGDLLRRSDGDSRYLKPLEFFTVAVSDEATAITTGVAKVTFRMPYAFTLTGVRASLTAASTSGLPQVVIKENGVSILSTNITLDANEKTSTTAASPPVISDAGLADDAEITIDIVAAGTGAKGLKVTFLGNRA